MAQRLEQQLVHLPFRAGLETKSDPKDVQPPRLIALENATFVSPGRLRKRFGFLAGNTNVVNGSGGITTLNSGDFIANYNNELLLGDGRYLYSLSKATNDTGWVAKGPLPHVSVNIATINNDQYWNAFSDGNAGGGFAVYAWESYNQSQVNQGVYYCVVDSTTGQVLVPATSLAANGIKPKVIPYTSHVGPAQTGCAIYWYDTVSQKINVALLPATNPYASLNGTALTGAGASNAAVNTTNPNYDVCTYTGGSLIYLVFNNNNAGTTISSYSLTAPTAQQATASFGTLSTNGITVFMDNANNHPIIVYATSAAVKLDTYSANLSSHLISGQTLDTINSIVLVAGVSDSTNAWVYWTQVGSRGDGTDDVTRTSTVTLSNYSATAAADFQRNGGLVAKPFIVANPATGTNYVYVPMAYGIGAAYLAATTAAPLQTTYFLVDSAGTITAKAAVSTAGGRPTRANSGFDTLGRPCLAESFSVSGGFSCGLPVALTSGGLIAPSALGANIASSDGVALLQTGITQITWNFPAVGTAQMPRAPLANSIHFAGGILWMYDGISTIENNFHIYPEVQSYADNNGGGSLPNNTTFTWVFCYEWTDAQGFLHQSAPSPPLTTTTASASDSITFTLRKLRWTAKGAGVDIGGATQPRPRQDVQIVAYRTPAGSNTATGAIFRRVSSVSNGIAFSTDTVTLTDGNADTTIAKNRQLYTTGGILENIAADPPAAMCVHRDRIFMVDAAYPLTIWFSQRVIPAVAAATGIPVSFNDSSLIINVDPAGGPITALASLDDKLIVFKKDRVFYVVGQGPDSLGLNSDFSDTIIVSVDVGCTEPRSVTLTPEGLMFLSAKGICMLDRGLVVHYIGAPVESFNSLGITSAVTLGAANQARFTAANTDSNGNGVILVYDYFMKQWSTFVFPSAFLRGVDSCLLGGVHYCVNSTGANFSESSFFADNSTTPISMRALSAPVQFSPQGYQRLWKVYVLGDYITSNSVRVKLYSDFQTTPFQTDDASFPSTPPAQIRIQPSTQKCEAMQVEITDNLTNPNTLEGVTLSGLAFEFGVLPGGFRLPATQTFG